MIFPLLLPVTLLLQAALSRCQVTPAATNFSVDDQDPLFQYFGSWQRITTNLNSAGGNLDRDGGHMLSYTQGSTASIIYTFASVYFLAPLWPYPVSTDYQIDSNAPLTIDMQDHSVPASTPGGNATVASGVVGQWTSTVNQQHTILITIPAGAQYAVVDMFIFEVLSPSVTSSSISSTSQTSSSTGTTSATASSSSSSSNSSSSSSSSSGSQGPSLTVERDLAISMGVVGTSLAILLIFLLWRFCVRRKGEKGGNVDTIMPQYHSVPTIPGNGPQDPLNDNLNSVSMPDAASTSRYGPGIQNNNLYRPPNALSYDRGVSSYSSAPSTLYTDQSTSSLPRSTQNLNPQRHSSILSMMSDRPPMYRPTSTMDESAAASSSSNPNAISNEKSRILANTLYTAVAEPEVELTWAGRQEENIRGWDKGYPNR